MQPQQDWADELHQLWSPVAHLNAVANNDELRAAYNACLPLLSEYSTELGQNQALCALYQKLHDSQSFTELEQAQQQAVRHALRDFRLGGVDCQQRKSAFWRD